MEKKKITVGKSELTKALVKNEKFKCLKKDMENFGFITFSVHGNEMNISMENEKYKLVVPVQVENPENAEFSFTIRKEKLSVIVKMADDQLINIYDNGCIGNYQCTVVGPNTYMEKLDTSEMEKYNTYIPDDDENLYGEISKHKDFVEKNMDNRPALQYVCFQGRNIISTDSYRMCVTDLDDYITFGYTKFTVFWRAVELISNLREQITQVDLYMGKNVKDQSKWMKFSLEDGDSILAKSCDAGFPEVSSFWRSKDNYAVKVQFSISEMKEIHSAFKKVCGNDCTIRYSHEHDQFDVVRQGTPFTKNIISYDVDKKRTVEEFTEICYQNKFMLDILKNVWSRNGKMEITFYQAMKPMYLYDETNTWYVLLPVRIY